ncbi:histidine phosphatase family protein [Variovorax sp. VNK109]|jgi:probable phosphoglycerate mutase|uniref:histidine phosphatase family protein n=1 Tax=Variovorax sp. VNK109 TaxID=3400919 RepID=UPI003C024EDB
MTEFILIRHGETDWNRELRFQGHVDVPLNATGLEQARRLGLRLEGEQIHHFYASDLTRTRQTAEPAQKVLSLDPVFDNTLREQHFGAVEGMRVDDIKAEHPDAWAQWTQFLPDYAMPGGESTRQFHERVMNAMQRLALAHGDQTVLVVTHGGVLDMVYRTARSLGLHGPRQSDIPNAGVNRVRVGDGKVEIIDWADTRHLVDLPAQPVYDQARYSVTLPNPKVA